MSLFTCPHCNITIEIVAVNCGIFRCGVYKDTGEQVHPHLSKEECAKLGDSIYGCAQPFQFINGKIVKCGWL